MFQSEKILDEKRWVLAIERAIEEGHFEDWEDYDHYHAMNVRGALQDVERIHRMRKEYFDELSS